VVGQTALREIVGSNALAAIATAYLQTALLGLRGVLLLLFGIKQTRFQ